MKPAKNPKPEEYVGGGEDLETLDQQGSRSAQDKAMKHLNQLLSAEKKGEKLSEKKVYRFESIQ